MASVTHQENRTNDRPETGKHICCGRANHAVGRSAGDNYSFISASTRSKMPEVVTRPASNMQTYLYSEQISC